MLEKKNVMRLPELNCLKPNEQTTFRKLVEEIVECNTAIVELKVYEEKHNSNYLLLSDEELYKTREEYKIYLNNVLGEVMDIAQTCASQLFVFENNSINVHNLFADYMKEKSMENYEKNIMFQLKNNCRYIYFTPTNKTATLQNTMSMIFVSMGIIAQLGKFIGANGEIPTIDEDTSVKRYTYELFNTIQYCFNLLYSMEYKYHMNLTKLFNDHIDKLVRKGYCDFSG